MPLVPTDTNMQRHPEVFIPLMYKVQRFFDCHSDLLGVKSFSLIPTTLGFGHKYITIDTTSLRALMASVDPSVPSETVVIANKDLYWNKLFRVAKVDTAHKGLDDAGRDDRRSFAHCIYTDGKSVSIRMKKPKHVARHEKELRPEDFDLVWGLDPGVKDMQFYSAPRTIEGRRSSAVRASSTRTPSTKGVGGNTGNGRGESIV